MSNNNNLVNNDENLFTGRVVLACIDGSSASESVCDYASWISSKVNRPLKLVHTIEQNHNAAVSDYTGAIGLGSQQDLLDELTEVEQSRASLLIKKGQLMLSAAKERVVALGIEKVETYQHHGSLAEEKLVRYPVIRPYHQRCEYQCQPPWLRPLMTRYRPVAME